MALQERILRPRRTARAASGESVSGSAVGSAGSAVGSAGSAVPEGIAQRFGNPKARPKVVQIYNPKVGWSACTKRVAVTEDLLVELRAAGVTRIDARWRKQRHQISLFGYEPQ